MSMDPDPNSPTAPAPTPGAPVVGTNGFAIAALVLGILGLVGFPPFVSSILALIFGYKGRGEIDRSGGTQQGRGMADAGIVLGWIGVFLMVLALAGLAFLFAWSATSGSIPVFGFVR